MEDIKELKFLLYTDNITPCGKRKLVKYYEDEILRQKQTNEELTKKIKELEKENQRLKAKIDVVNWQEKTAYQCLKEKYIPKQKIKEKIEELKNEKEQLRIDKNVTWDSQIYKLDLKIQVLQELLQEEDK